MLESLIKFEEINERPYLIFFWAFLLTSVAAIISNHIAFTVTASSVTINMTGFFTVLFSLIPAVYFVTLLIKKEERLEERMIRKHYRKGFWERHRKDIVIFLLFFAGVTLAFAVWTILLPQDTFQVQDLKIREIRGLTGSATQMDGFYRIAVNNMQVLMFSFFFSFVFGAGALFIIIWNASVLGVFIGQLSKSLVNIPLVSLNFLPHGIPEIAAYLFAGLAGGLLSAAILRKNSTSVLKIVAFDSLKLLIVGIALIFLAAGIEIYV